MAEKHSSHAHAHAHACDCSAHKRGRAPGEPGGAWSALLPLLACAVCPACLSMYAKLLSVLGVGIGLSETHHEILLALAVSVSVILSARRSYRTRRAWPLLTALAGAGLIVAGHLAGDLHIAEWAGVLVLLVGGWVEHFRLRAPVHAAEH